MIKNQFKTSERLYHKGIANFRVTKEIKNSLTSELTTSEFGIN